ncbi:MAG: hypothetical protein ACO1Q7_15405 [Gemmatimonas sp.]
MHDKLDDLQRALQARSQAYIALTVALDLHACGEISWRTVEAARRVLDRATARQRILLRAIVDELSDTSRLH